MQLNTGTAQSPKKPKLSLDFTKLKNRENPLPTPLPISLQTPKTAPLTANLKTDIESFVEQLKSNDIQVLSLDFDGTLTGKSTFQADISDNNLMSFFGVSKEKQEEQVSFINDLFSECKKNNIECIITSRSKTDDLTRIFKAITPANIPRIIGGDKLAGYAGDVIDGNKAITLHRDFEGKKILHIDDNVGEKSEFAKDEFRHVKYEGSFSLKPALSLETLSKIFNEPAQNAGRFF